MMKEMIDYSSILVSIITVNYYSEKDILECFKSIYSLTNNRFELILVSNSPVDPALHATLKSYNIDATIIENKENLGFAKACNIGAKNSSGDFLFFLNPDTRFLNDVIEKLFKCFYEKPSIGLIGPHTFDETGHSIPSVKNAFSVSYLLHLMFPPLVWFLNQDRLTGHYLPNKTQKVSVINGHAMFISTDLFNDLNGMEERFFMYWEENDLCKRVQEANKSVLFCHSSKLMHIGSTSTSNYFFKMEIEKHRSQMRFVKIHFPKLLFLNRMSGTIGYFWRTLLSLLLFRKNKTNQFWKIFIWYCFRYS